MAYSEGQEGGCRITSMNLNVCAQFWVFFVRLSGHMDLICSLLDCGTSGFTDTLLADFHSFHFYDSRFRGTKTKLQQIIIEIL